MSVINSDHDQLTDAIIQYSKLFISEKIRLSTIEDLSDGLILANLLKSAEGLRFNFGELKEKPQNWSQKVTNLKVIIKKVQWYFEAKIGKGIKTKDINLVQIAHHSNHDEIFKLFEIILAVLTQAPNKEDHINKILSLEEKIQKVFVELIQSITEQRIILLNETKEDKFVFLIEQYETQNALLREELQNMQSQKQQSQKQLQYLKGKIKKSEDEFQKKFDNSPEEMNVSNIYHSQQLKGLVQNLKKKLLTVTREHEHEIFTLKEEIEERQHRIMKLEKYEEVCQFYQEKYNETQQLILKAKNSEREKIKMLRQIDEKDTIIKKIQQKMDHLMEDNCALQEREIYLQMQLEKREVRFRQLEKQVKRRINTGDQSTFTISQKSLSGASSLQEFNQSQREQMEDMKTQLEKIKAQERQNSKENNRLKREVQKYKNHEKEKKKLQGIILELSKQKKDQLEILLGTLGEMSLQNRKYHRLLIQNNIEVQ